MKIKTSRLRHSLIALIAVASCAPSQPPAPTSAPAPAAAATPQPSAPVVEVTAVDYAFRAPEAIPSGWTTFHMRNDGEEHHLIFLTRLPDGRTFDEYMVDVGTPYDLVWKRIDAGEIDKAQAGELLGQVIPEWFWTAERMGGTGLVFPGGTSQATLNLKPGTYVMECYLKTPEGEIHAMEGMAQELIVTEVPSGAAPPAADIRMTLSNYDIQVAGSLTPGRHTVAVHFAEHPEVGFGHDVHLVRLDGEANVAEIVPWMDWFNPQGFRNPAPATFLSGTPQMPEGYTTYFTMELEPGRYAWISQSAPERMLKEFTVR